jgi:sigma-B regulation protein RsbU (phosphoserine phosphatase)
VLVAALLFWWELSKGKLRQFNELAMIPAVFIAVAGVAAIALGKSPLMFMSWNNALAVCVVVVLLTVSAVPALSRRYLVVPGRVLAFGTLIFAAVALYINVDHLLGRSPVDELEPPSFAIFVLSLGYVTAEKVFANERRLVSIENELEIARGIQNSILPAAVPELDRARIAAAYKPMASVAGDFYEFVVVDHHRAGFLVADVSGHGVPAALIASMVKVAMQSVLAVADKPGDVMRGLNRVLTGQLRGQFVTAAYLWIDTERNAARYSAAGHPPLLYWHAASNELRQIESNGLLFGVLPDTEYPEADIALTSGDRLILYTDGVIEAENSAGTAFGDSRLEEVLRTTRAHTAVEVSDRLLAEVRNWQPQSATQQDDITLVIIDVI